MEQITLNFTASEQALNPPNSQYNFASNTVSYIKAVFELGENWSGYDSVRAVWNTDFECISTVLDSDNSCIVPQEVLKRTGSVMVNLVGSIVENGELTDRLTTYPSVALTVNANAKVCGTETAEITPSQFEQYVAMVVAEVEKVTGMTATAVALPEGSAPTAVYENGVLTLGIPKGDKGDTGNGISSVVFNADYSLTFNFTESEPYTTPSIKGERGAQGYGIVSVEKIGTAGLVDTYQVNYEDPSVPPTTFTVTNGAKGDTGNGISSVTKTGTVGLVDTYRITFTNGGYYDFNVTNGAKGDTGATGNGIASIDLTSTVGAVKTYTITFTDGTTTTFEVTDGEVTNAQLSQLLPTETASGAIASFNDGQAIIPAVSVVATITPTQSGSGTPSPSNVRPISGHDSVSVEVVGKNWMPSTVHNTAPVGTTVTTGAAYRAIYAKVIGGQTYTLSRDIVKGNRFRLYVGKSEPIANATVDFLEGSADGDASLSKTFTIPSGYNYLYVYLANDGSEITSNFLLELGSSVTTYIAYNGQTHTTTLPSTTYGGTLDLVSGVLTVTYVLVDMGTLNWVVQTSGGVIYFCVYLTDAVMRENTKIHCVCSCYPSVIGYGPSGINSVDKAVSVGSSYIGGNYNLLARDSSYTTASDFKTSVTGQTLCYELSTPQTYQLTPQQINTLLGQNNVWADCGNVSITYKADIQKYIDNAIATALA